ncbi:DUF2267 domain-containing protein [Actinacidiphila acidipaludis]|uniref:DUF2267 domain-containing protein n=1 Tax=Actinacidiphila acidipaludis TaxID=2873382 RepID=A0ABS7QHH4_9ACTN|nr:DUF2267 domain-containing protein [Streptomyces acidipaludis]MBY8882626.1 DUF2267 domain-containing protein [Streptomyces acidipaludis]
MTWHELVQQARHHGRYATDEEAENVLQAVLAALGAQLVAEERCELAAILPEPARTTFCQQIPLTQPLTAPAFVGTIARALGTTPAQARWDTTSALAALTELADLTGQPPLIDHLLAQLPRGYALLFCRPELTSAA